MHGRPPLVRTCTLLLFLMAAAVLVGCNTAQSTPPPLPSHTPHASTLTAQSTRLLSPMARPTQVTARTISRPATATPEEAPIRALQVASPTPDWLEGIGTGAWDATPVS